MPPAKRKKNNVAVPHVPTCGTGDGERVPTENEMWYIINAYMKKYGVVRHQVESFNNFIHYSLPHIVQEGSEIRVKQDNEEHVVTICNLSVHRPTHPDIDGTERDLYPQMARLRGLTYASMVLVDVVHDIYDSEGKCLERRLFRETCLCRLPVMLGSTCCHMQYSESKLECRLDQGAYFIVSGGEKVVIAQEKLHHNTPYVFSIKQPNKFALQCEIRSCHERKLRSTSTLTLYITNSNKGAIPEIVVELPFLKMKGVPVLALFRLLGVKDCHEAMTIIVGDQAAHDWRQLSSMLENDSTADFTVEELFDHLGREGTTEPTREKRQRYLEHIINCEVLPHQGLVHTPEVLFSKALFLGLMVRKLVRVYNGELQCDDRDHYATKRVDCAGTQFALLFRQVFRNVHKSLLIQIQKAADAKKLSFTNVGSLVAGRKLTQAFRYALATGNWGIMSTRGNTAQNGVAQQLSRMTIPATISLLRKVSTPVARETKNPKPRQLHPTAWGIICPQDTPEGSACGLTKSLAMQSHIRVGTFSNVICDHLRLLMKRDSFAELLFFALECPVQVRRSGIPVLVNGVLFMFVNDVDTADKLCTQLRLDRRQQSIPFDSTIYFWEGYLGIDTDPGCLMRPLIRVEMLQKIPQLIKQSCTDDMLLETLFSEGVFEYIDKQEEESLRVALSPLHVPTEGWNAYTHVEFDPSMILGLCGGCIPFADMNQSPRNTYQSAMMKQALGVYSHNYPVRMDTIAHTMACPQQPIVTTRLDSIVGVSEAPAGINCMIAILCYTGQNQEDSVIVNEKALQRGLFRSVKLQTFRDEERQNGGTDAERIEPILESTKIAGKKDASYKNIDQSGVVAVGTKLSQNDVIISKTITTTELGEGARKAVKRDKSTVLRHENGTVDAVLHVTNHDGTKLVKIRVRKTREPMLGDKVSSRMGQKGVIGSVMPEEDMPYTEDGMRPDIIVNPHAIPSRMTIGQLAEQLLNILCCLKGERGDGTVFRGTSLEYLCDQLEKAGFDRHGRQKLHNGFTGEAFESLVFMGPTYYQRLRHMSADKDHARARGPIHMLSRQPTEGRARDGGLRFGEMERDTLISHGTTEFMKDRLLDNSDPSIMTVCATCGNLAQPAALGTHVRNKTPYCNFCKSSKNIGDMNVPFTFRLFVQELQAMHVSVKFAFDQKK